MTTVFRSAARLPIGRIAAAMLALALVPLALLTYFTLTLAGDAVERQVRDRLQATATLSALVVESELTGLAELVSAYAQRPNFVESVAASDESRIAFHLSELREARRGIYTTFVARPDGRLVEVVPATPSIVGDDFSFRDWFHGVSETGRPYVSEAYRTQATGTPLVVAAAAPVERDGRRIGIVVAAYSVAHLNAFTDRLAVAQGVIERVTDQRGTIVAAGGGEAVPGQRIADDPRVAAALAGRSGIVELDTPDGRRLSAFAPIPSLGWTITTSVPSNTAFAAVERLRLTVLAIAGVLAVLMLVGIALLARTLGARRRAEEAARRQAQINSAVLEATTDGISLVDLDGRIAVANGAFEQLVSEIIGEQANLVAERRQMSEIAAGIAERTTDPDRYREAFAAVAADVERVSLDEYELADSGRAIERYSAPVRNADGTLIGRLLVLRDVTAQREAERLKSDLVATVSHELRTPLTGVLGFAELAAREDVDEGTRVRYARTIHAEAKRLNALINDFLDIQRIEAGGFTLSIEPFDVRPLLEQQVELHDQTGRPHRFELDVPGTPILVAGDAQRVTQVIANLVSNAIKYSPEGGAVRVAVEELAGRVRVSVSDEGIGIPADQQRLVFTKFFRVDSTDTRRIGGTGLGLALCREIVSAHGGRIGFSSRAGEGSTFWFELPAASSDRPGRRVLVIEGDDAAAALLEEWLSDAGYVVEVAASGAEGLRRARSNPPAVICLDTRLPGSPDGWHVLATLKDEPVTANVPIVVCTGDNGRSRAAALGASDFLAKPFTAEQLAETVERILPTMRGDVLVVDDDETVRSLVVETLARGGLTLRVAGDGAEAIGAIDERRPDAIVLDLLMPEVDGFEVLEYLQRRPETRTIPVVVLTAHRLSAAERGLLSQRSVSLLEKTSYSAAELKRLVDRALGLTRAA